MWLLSFPKTTVCDISEWQCLLLPELGIVNAVIDVGDVDGGGLLAQRPPHGTLVLVGLFVQQLFRGRDRVTVGVAGGNAHRLLALIPSYCLLFLSGTTCHGREDDQGRGGFRRRQRGQGACGLGGGLPDTERSISEKRGDSVCFGGNRAGCLKITRKKARAPLMEAVLLCLDGDHILAGTHAHPVLAEGVGPDGRALDIVEAATFAGGDL